MSSGALTGAFYGAPDCSDEEIKFNLDLLRQPVRALPVNDETTSRTLVSGPGLFCGFSARADGAQLFPIDFIDGLDDAGLELAEQRFNVSGGGGMIGASNPILFRRGFRVKYASGTLKGAFYVKVLDPSQILA